MKLSPLDKLFSEFIRKRAIKEVGGCERCLTWKESYLRLQCSHFMGRRKRSVRFDEDNAVGLCPACHMYLTSNPLEHVEFFRKRLGQRYEMLEARANRPQKIDENALTLYLRYQIKILENG